MKANISWEIDSFLQERSKIWDKYDETIAQVNELNKFSQFNHPNVAQKLSPQTKNNSPPEELSAAVWKIKQESEKIKKCQSNIRGYQSEIENTKRQFKTTVVVVVILIFILVAVIAFQMG